MRNEKKPEMVSSQCLAPNRADRRNLVFLGVSVVVSLVICFNLSERRRGAIP